MLQDSAFIGGENVREFAKAFADFHQVGHCIPCGNGSDSLEIVLRAWEIGPGDEVLVPDLTWVATAGAVSLVGATPVFVDIHPDHYTMDPTKIRSKISSRTKAIIPVHLYGLPCVMDEILSIAKHHGLKVLEDCAQAHGSQYKGQMIGTFGDAGSFSFYPSKNLGAFGDSGAIVTQDEALAEKCRLIGNHGQPQKNTHLMLGRNSRMDAMQAAILRVKLNYLSAWNEQRQEVAAQYHKLLADVPVKTPFIYEGSSHVFHLYVIQTDHRDELRRFLAEKGIKTGIHYPNPLHKMPMFQSLPHRELEVAENITGRILSLPIFPELSHVEVQYVCDCIKSFFNG